MLNRPFKIPSPFLAFPFGEFRCKGEPLLPHAFQAAEGQHYRPEHTALCGAPQNGNDRETIEAELLPGQSARDPRKDE